MEKVTFWGRELNDYEIKNKRLSYATMAKCFNAVLCNNITEIDPDIIFNIKSGFEENEDAESEIPEIYQWFLVDDSATWILEKANEPLFYSDKLECYVWGVTHYGTAWSHVLTRLELDDNFNLK